MISFCVLFRSENFGQNIVSVFSRKDQIRTNLAPFFIPVVDIVKLFLEVIYISTKLRSWKSFFCCLNSATQKCGNNEILKQNQTLKLFIALKMALYCYFGFWNGHFLLFWLRGKSRKKFYNMNYWSKNVNKKFGSGYALTSSLFMSFLYTGQT